MLTLWLWLWLLPVAIGAAVETWGACLALVATYLVLFSLNSSIASIGTASALDVAALIVNDDLMILAVAVAGHGIRRGLSRP